MQVWKVLHAARWKYMTQKIAKNSPSGHHHTTLSGCISPTCPHSMVNFSPLTVEIGSVVCGIPPNFNGFRVLVPLLHGSLVVGVSETLRHWTKGGTYIHILVCCVVLGGIAISRWSVGHVCYCSTTATEIDNSRNCHSCWHILWEVECLSRTIQLNYSLHFSVYSS